MHLTLIARLPGRCEVLGQCILDKCVPPAPEPPGAGPAAAHWHIHLLEDILNIGGARLVKSVWIQLIQLVVDIRQDSALIGRIGWALLLERDVLGSLTHSGLLHLGQGCAPPVSALAPAQRHRIHFCDHIDGVVLSFRHRVASLRTPHSSVEFHKSSWFEIKYLQQQQQQQSELLRMARVWAIVEVPYTQTNAWVMAVLAKVVVQVNG